VVPAALETGNEFSKLAKKISPSVVSITADYTPKPQVSRNRRARPQGQGEDDGSVTIPPPICSGASSATRPPARA